MGPELARWCTGDAVHEEVDVMDRLLLLLADEWSVICVFGRPELVYDEWRDGDDVADAGDEGRKIAKVELVSNTKMEGVWFLTPRKVSNYLLLTLT